MAVLCVLDGSVIAAPAAAQAPHGSVDIEIEIRPPSPPASQISGTVSVADDAGQIFPTQQWTSLGTMTQLVVLKIYYGASWIRVPTAGWEVGHTATGTTWRLTFPADSVRSLIGWEVDHDGAPAGGLGSWRIEAEYGASGVAIPLLVGGQSETSERTVTREGNLLAISGRGPEICYDQVTVDYQLAAHHGKTQGEMIREEALLVGIPSSKIAVGAALGSPRANAVNIGNQPGWPEMQLQADSMNRRLYFEQGELVAPLIIPDTPSEITFTLKDLVAVRGLGDVDTTSQKPATIVVRGTRSERQTDRAGSVTAVRRIDVVGPKSVEYAYFEQSAGSGTLAAPSSPTGPQPEEILPLSTIITRETRTGGCLEFRSTESYGWHKRRAGRYVLDNSITDVAIGDYRHCYIFDSGAVADDGTEAFHYIKEKFELLNYEFEEFERDEGGRLTTSTLYRGSWFLPRAAFKFRASAATAWDTVNVTADTGALADLTAVAGGKALAIEEFYGYTVHPITGIGTSTWPFDPEDAMQGVGAGRFWAEKATTTINNTTDNYRESEKETLESYRVRRGFQYLYSGNTTSSEATEKGGVSATTETHYQTSGQGSHRKITTKIDEDGKPVVETEDGIEGWPASDICNQESLDALESTAFQGSASVSLGSFKPYSVDESNPYLENDEEASAYAWRRLVEEHAITLTFAVVLAAPLRRNMRATVDFVADGADHGWAGEGYISELRHLGEAGEGGASQLTEVTFELLVIE